MSWFRKLVLSSVAAMVVSAAFTSSAQALPPLPGESPEMAGRCVPYQVYYRVPARPALGCVQPERQWYVYDVGFDREKAEQVAELLRFWGYEAHVQ